MTFRKHEPQTVIDLAVEAGLESIEWGSDVHVSAGNLKLAARVGAQTRAAGLTVASYGSYFRFPWSDPPGEQVNDIIDTAVALGAPRIRVWAGPTGSAHPDSEERARTTQALAEMHRKASRAGLETAIEFHLGTLTDTVDSTLRLLEDLDTDGASAYWQPRIGATDLEAIEDLRRLGDLVSTVHVFSWGAQFERHLLDTREEMWREVTRSVVSLPRVTDLLLEFLPNDDDALLEPETRQLKGWLDEAMERISQ
ncbi:sugar phosphate isomerase/epimerase family protein [Arthrobacter sp. B2a2-09]|uniref:sugar phosphate isomerase/epimerase family protein n=1 Tax=Arthrobacter sp. B2a2-09 TaxID=2952822 RepID=UPI0022CD3792|nr:TIM barrel protein [Arthrobacter sp. B2a2-09]